MSTPLSTVAPPNMRHCPFPRIPFAQSKQDARASPCQTQAKKKYIRASFIFRYLSRERIPDVLITWNQPDRRSDRETVEGLEPIFVFRSGRGCGESRDVIF